MIGGIYDWVGFDVVDDAVFRDLVIARIVEPTSKVDSLRVLADLGADADVLQDYSAAPRDGQHRQVPGRDRREVLRAMPLTGAG